MSAEQRGSGRGDGPKSSFCEAIVATPKADGTPLDSFDIPHDGVVFTNYPPY